MPVLWTYERSEYEDDGALQGLLDWCASNGIPAGDISLSNPPIVYIDDGVLKFYGLRVYRDPTDGDPLSSITCWHGGEPHLAVRYAEWTVDSLPPIPPVPLPATPAAE